MSKGSRQRPTSSKFGTNFDSIDWSKKREGNKADDRKPARDTEKAKGGDK